MTRHIYLILTFLGILFQSGNTIAQEYIVGGDYDYSPFSYVDKSGKASGFDIDVLEAIFNESKAKLNYQLSRWDSALSNIESGEIDIITGIIFSEERKEFLDFTNPIHIASYSLFIRADLPLTSLSSLYDYKPVVLDKDISIEKYLIPMGLYKNHITAKSLPEALSKVELGHADYVIAPYLLGMNEIKMNNYKNIEVKGSPILPSMYCLGVKKGNTQLLSILNNGILELRKNGKLSDIQKKWNVNEKEELKYRQIAKIIEYIFIAAIVLLIIVFIWVWLLRVQIRKKTESLNLKNQELQKSEEKFRIITENSSDIIWHLDSNFLLTYISPSDERIRGFKKDDIIGNSLFSILKPEGIELIKEANNKRLLDLSNGIKSAPVIYELEEICKDGSWVWVEATATAYHDQNGNISGYHGVSRDITERKKAELLLKEQESQLRELVSTKDKLFSIIAHDLRSPFNGLLCFSELLIKNPEDLEKGEAESYLEMINSLAKNTLDLLDNLLSWAKAQTGQLVFKPEKTNLSAIVREILEISKPIAKLKEISLNYIQEDDIEVYADVNMLKTILRNLISNAIKFTKSNGEVKIYAIQKQDSIEINISDNGIGMSEEAQNKIFIFDKKAIISGTANEKGSGLGLMLCKEFVEKHGGKIWVESKVGKGSDFKFSLPLE